MTAAEWIYEYNVPLLMLIAAMVTALLFTLYALIRRLPRTTAGMSVVALRLIFFILLFWTLLMPGRKSSLIEIVKPRFVVLLDRSASMEHKADESATQNRWESAQAMLKKPGLQSVAARCLLDVYPFHAELDTPVSLEKADELLPDGRATHLNRMLNLVIERLRGQDLTGILVLSDGLDTREKNEQWSESSWPTPIYTVELEQSVTLEQLPDLRVEQIDTPLRAIVDWDTSMSVTIAGEGGKGESFPVILLRNDKEIERINMKLPPEGGSRDIQFQLTHPEVGTENYEVKIPPLPGEVQTNDNTMLVAVNVLDAKNRVLFLEDVPRFESKHLSRALVDNKDITPLSFFQMPNTRLAGAKEWIPYGDRQGFSFDLTLEQLKQNKIIILGDFDSTAISAEHCRTILEFVEHGGSLILLGGQKLWGDNGIAKTELVKLLPFQRAGAPAIEGRFNVRWSAEGMAHPALANNPDLPTTLPPILSVFTGATLSGGAFSLAEAETPQGTIPMLVSRSYGQGKVLAVLTDSLWRWVMQPEADKPYQKFWRQIIQWMSPAADEMERYYIELFTDAVLLTSGEPAILQSRLVVPPDDTRRTWRVNCTITTPSEREIKLSMTGRDTGGPGGQALPDYLAEFTPDEPGNYRAVASVEIDGKKIESAACLLTVRTASAESQLKSVNNKVLISLARFSGGRHGTPDEIDRVLQELRTTERQERKLEYRVLWQNPWILSLLILLLAIEWISRKLQNLV